MHPCLLIAEGRTVIVRLESVLTMEVRQPGREAFWHNGVQKRSRCRDAAKGQTVSSLRRFSILEFATEVSEASEVRIQKYKL